MNKEQQEQDDISTAYTMSSSNTRTSTNITNNLSSNLRLIARAALGDDWWCGHAGSSSESSESSLPAAVPAASSPSPPYTQEERDMDVEAMNYFYAISQTFATEDPVLFHSRCYDCM